MSQDEMQASAAAPGMYKDAMPQVNPRAQQQQQRGKQLQQDV